MSAAVCGSKRSFWEENSPTSSVSSKKLRCSSASPPRFSHPPSPTRLLDQLRSLFPHMEPQLLEGALKECGNDLNSAIKSLHQLRLGSAAESSVLVEEPNANLQDASVGTDGNAPSSDLPSALNNLPASGAEWVELFVNEMTKAGSLDDARVRAANILELLEKSICSRAANEATESYQKENMILKQQIEVLVRDNSILKRAVTIQHERQKEYDDKNRELDHLKQLLSQYQEQLRVLEVNNYALKMHLKQAEQSSSISGRFNPDVF